MKDAIKASLFFIIGFFIQSVFILTGVFICLLPKTKYVSDLKPFTEYPGNWYPVHLPSFFWYWDNDEDGARGDHRGWYWNASSQASWPEHLKYYWWLAFRNPANNFKRYVLGCDIRKHVMETLYGQDYVRDDFNSTGWQLVRANPKSGGITRYHFYLVLRYFNTNYALVIELGNKVQERHNGVEYEDQYDFYKGFTIELNPLKDIS